MTYKDILEHCERKLKDKFILLNKDTNKWLAKEYVEHRMVAELIKKAEQYKWHDLQKNPDDLPQVGEPITIAEIFISDFGNYVEYHSVHMNERQECITPDDDYLTDIKDVCAWKYIEPLEREVVEF